MTGSVRYYDDQSLSALTYDFLENAVQDFKGDADFYLELAARTGGPVLDIGTGTGRIAWMLAEAGHAVVGVDLSAAMLLQAEAKRARQPAEVQGRCRFLRQDMTELSVDGTFPLVLIPYRSFHHLMQPEQQRRALVALRRHMVPGGRAALHLFDPRPELFQGPEGFDGAEHTMTVRHPRNGQTLRWTIVERHIDLIAQTLAQTVHFEVLNADGVVVRSSDERNRVRWVTQQEMRYLLELSGLAVESLYSDFTGGGPASGKEQVWVLRRAEDAG
jgi:ubiquinone/menaquinone biosynthesis C-methylase UbiE